MSRILRSLIALLVGFAIFYNIERLDLSEVNLIDMDSIVYPFGLIAVISVLLLPILQRYRRIVSVIVWIGIYCLIKLLLLLFFDGRPLLEGFYLYLTFTEIALLSILVWLSHSLATHLREFEEAVKRISFPHSNRQIRQFREADEDIQVEMFRSRYHHHPLSIILVKPEPSSIEVILHRLVQEIQQAMLSNYVINNMAQTLSKYLRRTDLILEQRDQGRFIIVCPETNAKDSELLVEYIQTVAQEQLGASVTYGVATFPDEAVTFEELIRRAESKLQNSPTQENL